MQPKLAVVLRFVEDQGGVHLVAGTFVEMVTVIHRVRDFVGQPLSLIGLLTGQHPGCGLEEQAHQQEPSHEDGIH